ncbi:MAG: TonB family protein [Syntrophobacterales bacterium]|jgi:TonB family protein
MSLLPSATERGLFSGSLLISLGLHLVLATLVLFGGGLSKPGPPPVLTVSLVAPGSALPGPGGFPALAGAPGAQAKSPGAPSAAVHPAPPPPKIKKKPKKRQAKPIPRPRPQRALPEIPARPTPPPVVQAPTPPKPAALHPAIPPTPAAATAGSSRAGSGGTAGTGRARVGSGAPSSAVLGYGQGGKGGGSPATAQRHYLKLIRARILAQRKYPYMARQRHQEGVVRLRFTLCPAGTLSQSVEVVKPSGFDLLDKQARQCVLAAAPFPPFPLDLKRERLIIDLPIIYKISELER